MGEAALHFQWIFGAALKSGGRNNVTALPLRFSIEFTMPAPASPCGQPRRWPAKGPNCLRSGRSARIGGRLVPRFGKVSGLSLAQREFNSPCVNQPWVAKLPRPSEEVRLNGLRVC